MGPWDNEEVVHLIDLYRQQIDEFGDDHIDFQVGLNLMTPCGIKICTYFNRDATNLCLLVMN